MYTIQRHQTVGATIEAVWGFISNLANLNGITPPSLAFEIRSPLPDKMFDGLLVEYQIKIPLWGRRTWLTEIKHIRPLLNQIFDYRRERFNAIFPEIKPGTESQEG
ncbi:MAG: hypothetical protein QM498_12860 [Desulfobacterium sp.]